MHPNIVTFWEVFEGLTAEEKKKFLCKYYMIDNLSSLTLRWSGALSISFSWKKHFDVFFVISKVFLNSFVIFVVSVPHRLQTRTLPGYGEHQDESRRLARRLWDPSARIAHLPLSVIAAHLREIPSGEDHADQAPQGYQPQQRLLEGSRHWRRMK